MSSAASTRSLAIIGVVGRTFKAKDLDVDGNLPTADRTLLQLAQKVGQLIAARGDIVLTGGHHEKPENSVKYCTLVGAAQVSPARVIGILPKSISKAVKVKPVVACLTPNKAPLRCLYVHTGLSSEERNPLTGSAADALIALKGVSGTPQEVDAALAAPRPVVFLNSWKVLKPLLSDPPSVALLAKTPKEAVENVLNALGLPYGPAPRLNGCFPGTFDAYTNHETYTGQTYAHLKAEYEQELPRLCS